MDNPSETKDEMESDEDQPTVFSNNLDMMDDDFASIVDGMSGDDGTVQTQINDEDSERYLDTPLSFVQLDRMLKEMFHNEEITKISELRMLLEKEQQEAQVSLNARLDRKFSKGNDWLDWKRRMQHCPGIL